MGKRKKNTNKKKAKVINYGTVEFYCKRCDHTFEMDWETIWDIQECTHGYVGYHLNDTFISCPKCDEICGDEVDEAIPEVKKSIVNLSGDLPF